MITTKRLTLAELNLSDWPFIIELLNTPGWLQYIGDRNVNTEEQAKAYLTNGPIKSYREFGFGLMKVSLTETNQPIGMCGLLKREALPHPDLGFAFLPQFNGKGFALEAVTATVEQVRKEHTVKTILAITLPNNLRSIQLLEKLKFEHEMDLILPGSTEKLWRYKTELAKL